MTQSLVTLQEGQGVHHAGGGPEWPMPPIRFGGATRGSPGGLAGHQIQSLRVPWSKSFVKIVRQNRWKSMEIHGNPPKSLVYQFVYHVFLIPLDICGLSMFRDNHHVKHHGSLDDHVILLWTPGSNMPIHGWNGIAPWQQLISWAEMGSMPRKCVC